ncbi:MAG: hypothetical protein IE927_16800 [Rhodobacterales bacterium]|nr:hypothetical protein [Rhodobacterales bacterium]
MPTWTNRPAAAAAGARVAGGALRVEAVTRPVSAGRGASATRRAGVVRVQTWSWAAWPAAVPWPRAGLKLAYG